MRLFFVTTIPIESDFNPRIPCGMRPVYFFIRRTINAYFNPRIPCGMRRIGIHLPLCDTRFQSTHPMRDATSGKVIIDPESGISIHASHAGCDKYVTYDNGSELSISIHASHAGCDSLLDTAPRAIQNFNPRIPCGMRHAQQGYRQNHNKISIHASHAGCDDSWDYVKLAEQEISIHASHAGCDL